LAELVVSPLDKCDTFVAGSDGDIADDVTSSNGEAGSGECLPQMPEGGLSDTAISHGDDLQAREGSRPVENQFGNQVDTKFNTTAQSDKRQPSEKGKKSSIDNSNKQIKRRTQILGYVPIQVVNLSLEELELQKQTYVGEASPIGNGNVVQKMLR